MHRTSSATQGLMLFTLTMLYIRLALHNHLRLWKNIKLNKLNIKSKTFYTIWKCYIGLLKLIAGRQRANDDTDVIALDFAWHCRLADIGQMSGIMRPKTAKLPIRADILPTSARHWQYRPMMPISADVGPICCAAGTMVCPFLGYNKVYLYLAAACHRMLFQVVNHSSRLITSPITSHTNLQTWFPSDLLPVLESVHLL